MLKKNAMRWVKALRSGKYKQGQGKLKTFDANGDATFCCLGVLADICGADPRDNDVLTGVNEECGLDSESGEPRTPEGNGVLVLNEYGDLADANDNGQTFKQIATWIEKNYKLL